MSDPRRYARQMLVAEVGEQGQRRIGAFTAAVSGDGLAREMATSYALRAGVGRVTPGAVDETRWAPSFLEHGAPRAVVAGSRAALAALRAALFGDTGGGRRT